MHKELWDKIIAFDFDNEPSDYGFSVRLACENFWTKDFTKKVILEYKKFMYLAATSDFMVSPSETIDTVWHQHLIFTQSYQNFCQILGKQIQHIPSTHNKEDFQKFKLAKERTVKFYETHFGKQPKSIWEFKGMYESLNLEKAKLKLRTFIIIGILIVLPLTIPFFYLLKPIYISINNPYFIIGFACLVVLTFIILEFYNQAKLKTITKHFDKNSFVYNLEPYELVYLKNQNIPDIINGVLNELIVDQTIKIKSDNTLKLDKIKETSSVEQFQITRVLAELGTTSYQKLLGQLIAKPIFWNTANCMDAFKKHFNKSKKFGKLFYLNFCLLSFLLLVGSGRLALGILRDKPVSQIFIALVILIILIIFYLNRLTKLVCTDTIPDLYKAEIIPNNQIANNWQWQYFLLGATILNPSFVPVVNYNSNSTSSSSDSGSSCGNSCGSSCGSSCSSCGGCGGD